MKMHAGELDIDAQLVTALLAAQFPHLAELPVIDVKSTGTVNAIYRIGDDLCARLPRLRKWASGLESELRWLRRLAPHLSLPIPEPVSIGQPEVSYPHCWAIFRWIEGRPYADEIVTDEIQAASDLAQFVTELRAIDPAGAPAGGRRPLRQLDADTREAIAAAGDVIDSGAAMQAWELALQEPPWTGAPVWIHADLLRPNLLAAGGRLRAVIDFGSIGAGDPAADVIAAWSVFGRAGRERYREALSVDDRIWNRARGYALHQAAMIIPYYAETNPQFVALARRTVEQVIADGRI